MNTKILLYIGVTLFIGVFVGYIITQSIQPDDYQDANDQTDPVNHTTEQAQGNNQNPNRDNCLTDDCLFVDDLEYPAGELSPEAQNALDEAIQDEYKALSTYEAVLAEFGTVRPFSMIKGAEQQHIASLKALYDKYDLDIPENKWPSKVAVPETMKSACQTGVDAEIANAALYKDVLLPSVTEYEDITAVFTSLMNASEQKHLPAFERCN